MSLGGDEDGHRLNSNETTGADPLPFFVIYHIICVNDSNKITFIHVFQLLKDISPA